MYTYPKRLYSILQITTHQINKYPEVASSWEKRLIKLQLISSNFKCTSILTASSLWPRVEYAVASSKSPPDDLDVC